MTKVLIIYTGGTIGMIHDSSSGVLKPLDFSHVIDNVPELKRLNYEITVDSFFTIKDSSNMKPEVCVELAEKIDRH